MLSKLIILIAACRLLSMCSSLLVKIKPIKLIKYEKPFSIDSTFANGTSRYGQFDDPFEANATAAQIEDIPDYVYDNRKYDSYEEYAEDVESNSSSADDDLSSLTTGYEPTATNTADHFDRICDEFDHRCQFQDLRKRPIVTGGGATVLNPFNAEASRNASYTIPLYGKTASYSGYVNVGRQQYDAYLFFWFFVSECRPYPPATPLVVWLQGQPGTSVLVGLFEEHGPYYMDDKDGVLRKREFAWVREFNVLYLDHCIPCGFSYADDAAAFTDTIEASAEAVYEALRQFFVVFDEFADNDVYLAGEYGCGKIIPAVCLTIQTRNTDAERPIKVKGAMIGNGMVDANYMVNYGHFWYHWGLVDPQIRRSIGHLEEMARGYIRADREDEVLDYFRYHIFVKLSEREYNSPYDVRYVNASAHPKESQLVDERLFRKWIHVGNSTYTFGHKYLSMKLLKEVEHAVPQLLRHHKLMFYNGQFDPLFPHHQVSRFLRNVGWPQMDKWYRSGRQNWYINDRLLGYSKRHQKLTQVIVRNAGHMVGQTQPETLFYLLKWFVNDLFPDSVKSESET